MNTITSISVNNLCKNFIVLSSKVKVKVLVDISFTCNKGELILLTGKNGSGKSTLLRIIAGIIKPSKGSVKTYGMIGYYPQNPQFNKGVTVTDFINYIGSLKNKRYKKDDGILWLNNFGITDKWKKMDVLLLSEGMKRRVGLSVSFLGNPDIILLDEPLENLDSETKENLLQYISEALDQHKTILVSTHEIETFQGFSTKAILLDKGVKQ